MWERSTTTIRSTPRLTRLFWLALLVLLLIQTANTASAQATGEYRTVSVADPYLELHTGPGAGYPIFHVIDRGEPVEIIMRRTDWFQVRGPDGNEGWVDRAQMERTLQPTGSHIEFAQADQQDFTDAKWEFGLLAGDFGGANLHIA